MVPDDSERRITQSARSQHPLIVRSVHRDYPAFTSAAVTPAATSMNIVVARYLLERPLLPLPLPHSWDFRPACSDRSPSGFELPFSSRSMSRWSRHIGHC